MFRTVTDTEPAPVEVAPAEPVPISVLSLDLAEPPVGGWAAYLKGRGIEVVTDDIGRESVSRSDARMLLAEQAEAEVRKREIMERNEQRMAAADQAWRAGLHKGVPWYRLPDGMSPGEAMAFAEAEANRHKSTWESLMEAELTGSPNSMVYQPFPNDADES
jgi:hypothetical protein